MKNENIENKANAAAPVKDETAKPACKKSAAGTPRENIRGFRGLRALCFSALLCAAAVVIAYLCKALTIGNSIRITFENLPIILCGYAFGPIAGLLCGACADFLNTAVSQYGLGGLNPILTAGAAVVGLCAGLMPRILPRRTNDSLRLCLSVLCAHVMGNMIVKSLGLYIYYRTPLAVLAIRVPLYLTIAAVEFLLLGLLLRSRGIRKALGGYLN